MSEAPTKRHRTPLFDLVANASIGAAAGVCEVTVNQPLIYFKNCIQTGTPIKLTPAALYRGYAVNAGSLAPITAVQVSATSALFKAIFERPDHKEPTPFEKAACAVGAGALSGTISGPSESVIVQQQQTGKGPGETFRDMKNTAGLRSIYRGTSFAMFRDGLFTAGFMALGPFLTQTLRDQNVSEVPARLGGGAMAGVVAAVVTHPADTIKTRLQGDYQGKRYKGVLDVVKEGGLFKGLAARGTRVIVGVCVISNVTDILTHQLNAWM